jgi:hypothetical protein
LANGERIAANKTTPLRDVKTKHFCSSLSEIDAQNVLFGQHPSPLAALCAALTEPNETAFSIFG